MQEKEELYWYWLCNLSGIGNKRIKRLLDVFKSPKAVFYAAPEALHGCTGLTQQNIETIMKNRNMEKVYKSFTQLQHKGISFIYKEGKQYPQNLLQLYDMPYGLYSKGQLLRADEPAVAMVGARGCSGYGRSVAYSFAKAFAQLGITVVSGMASGIDTAAHEASAAQRRDDAQTAVRIPVPRGVQHAARTLWRRSRRDPRRRARQTVSGARLPRAR